MKNSTDLWATIIGWLIAPFLGALIFMWYNHVYFQYPIPYWKMCILAAGFWVIPSKVSRIPFSIIFSGAVILQLASWIGLVLLPVFIIK